MSIVLSALPVGKIRWKLREVMAARKISNEDLAKSLKKHPTTISRLKGKDAISALSQETYGPCKLADLIEIEDD
jgi:putative transcriptional regulator